MTNSNPSWYRCEPPRAPEGQGISGSQPVEQESLVWVCVGAGGERPAGPRGLWFVLAAGLEKCRACALSFLPSGAEDCSQEAGLGCSSALPHRVLPALRWNQGGDASPFLSHVLEKAGWLRFPRPLPPTATRSRAHTHTYTHTHTHTYPPPPPPPVRALLTHFLQKTLCQGRCQWLGGEVVPGGHPTVGPKL